jgi:anti-sigma factor RsiW
MLADLVQPATFAHQVYTADARYPVEIPAMNQASLNQWVSVRMHTRLRAPDLSGQGLSLIGGRLLPSTDRMAAQFMYEDSRGQRLTVYVSRVAGESEYPGVRYVDEGELHVFYWRNQTMGYAVVGVLPAARLIAVADAVQRSVHETDGHS